MTPQEAQDVATVCKAAHGFCYICWAELLVDLIAQFPDREATFREAWAEEYDYPVEEASSA